MTSLNVSKSIIIIMVLLMILPCVPAANAAPVMAIDFPVNANAQEPVHIFVNITSNPAVDEVQIYYVNPRNNIDIYEVMEIISGNNTNGTWHFIIPPQTYKGTLRVRVFATDIGGNTTYVPSRTDYVNINLDGPEPVKPFPWGIVIIVAFLGVTLVATELIFKPGVYRKTGRQKAKALEEEDRKRELEEQENK